MMIVWEYDVEANSAAEFERAYGTQGEWCRLFQSAPGYQGSRLFRDVDDSSRYLTLDAWEDRGAFEAFMAARRAEYGELDQRLRPLSMSQRRLGELAARPGPGSGTAV